MSNIKSKDSVAKYKVIGLMSGTSLDGLDIALCVFNKHETGKWSFSIEIAETIRYAKNWQKLLSSAHQVKAEELLILNTAYGRLIGEEVTNFIAKNKIKGVDFIASHGHTIFHQPQKGFTFQLGNGNALHQASNLPTIWDFRTMDVALGGEGAPLVPIGDQLLFADYDVCLNLGGIANLSTEQKSKRIAYDICYTNMTLNYLAQKNNKAFDKNGGMASDGQVHVGLLKALSKVYATLRKPRPSLSREIFEKQIKPLLDNEKINLKDRLRTVTESMAAEIISAIGTEKEKNVLITGGGAHNSFLLYRLVELGGDQLRFIKPDDPIVNFKEALVFAFLGVLKVRGEENVLKSVTGALKNSSSGVMTGF
ncbi:anhydro-N-acetylmuramic acid kinase [Chryseotalea sanaruensis]|uniref:Anhydro-N-acetylmuramic acid kinase n=1 Tax=Chryseotalea sanaruensis TaxID=2482724 RepID=A0A401U783_9BACT|nr:anhydro-N-acetylmuramic acid kinase [Chryseotalea sanaruensis]GCC50745.1 anhydro-N-acetylmuramic acid kinase [Chryseotalea sanaruensis]